MAMLQVYHLIQQVLFVIEIHGLNNILLGFIPSVSSRYLQLFLPVLRFLITLLTTSGSQQIEASSQVRDLFYNLILSEFIVLRWWTLLQHIPMCLYLFLRKVTLVFLWQHCKSFH